MKRIEDMKYLATFTRAVAATIGQLLGFAVVAIPIAVFFEWLSAGRMMDAIVSPTPTVAMVGFAAFIGAVFGSTK